LTGFGYCFVGIWFSLRKMDHLSEVLGCKFVERLLD
jgi:hypothetical protein